MQANESFRELKVSWLDKVSHNLARGQIVRESILEQLNNFFDLLEQSIVTGDPAWLNGILDEWSNVLTQSELDLQKASIFPVLNQIFLITFETIKEGLDSDRGLELLGVTLPIFTHAFKYITQMETQSQVDQISKELISTRLSLEKLDRSKSDFIAVAAHELKTPLTLIEGYAAMLWDRFPDHDHSSSGVLLLKGMNNGIRRLQEIVDDMIDVSMIDNDMLTLNFQPLWIKQLLEFSQNELNKYTKERSQTFEVDFFDGSEEMTYGDPERLTQALRNIITNAVKYTPDGGKISISGRRLPGFVELTISDTGIGIDVAHHEEIFEKFGTLGSSHLHSSGKIKYKGGGPGLGLPITKGLIDAHGGTIWVESEGCDEIKCPGTTFHILLPFLKEAPDKKLSKLFEPLSNNSEPGVIHVSADSSNTIDHSLNSSD